MGLNTSGLTLSMQIKTDKIVEYKNKLEGAKSKLYLGYGLVCLSMLFVMTRGNSLLDYSISVFDNTFVARGSYIKLGMLDTMVLIILGFSVMFLYWHTKIMKKIKDKYEGLRLDIIETMNDKFCTHDHPCDCRRDYIRDMEIKGIDVVFK